MQTGDQIKSQPEMLSASPRAFAQKTKDFQSPNHGFPFHPFACQFSIDPLFRPRSCNPLNSETTVHIAEKVSLVTPHKRLKSPSFKFSVFLRVIELRSNDLLCVIFILISQEVY
jgi:hypothetical protein